MLLKDTLRYMWGISRARKDYLNSLRAGDEFYEAKMTGLAVLLSFFAVGIFTVINYFAKISFLKSEDLKLATQFTDIFGFPWFGIAVAIILYILILLFLGLLIPLSAYVLGKKQNIVRSIIAVVLSSPIIILLFITPTIFYLLIQTPQILILLLIWPIILLLWMLRILHRTATQVLQMNFSQASVFIFIMLAFAVVILLLIWLLIPPFAL